MIKILFETYSKGDKSLDYLRRLAINIGLISKTSGNPPSKSNMTQILTNPIYYGYFKLKGELYEGVHEPIISKDLFD